MNFRFVTLAWIAWTALGCTVTRVSGEDPPPRLESNGLLEGHAALGIRSEDDLLRLKFLDGESDGAVGEIVLWKLLRLEVGLLGVGVGLGPLDLALGVGFYEPRVPDFEASRSEETCDPGATPDDSTP